MRLDPDTVLTFFALLGLLVLGWANQITFFEALDSNWLASGMGTCR